MQQWRRRASCPPVDFFFILFGQARWSKHSPSRSGERLRHGLAQHGRTFDHGRIFLQAPGRGADIPRRMATRGRSMATTSPKSIPVLHVFAIVIGNGLEFYDFLSYAIFAVYIGKTFFPSHDPSANLILSLATFMIGFITRPIGGIVLGILGDRLGRKPAMVLSFILIGVAMLGIALTPGY